MRQGSDLGSQYRSAIRTAPDQRAEIEASRAAYAPVLSGYGDTTTEVAPAGEVYSATGIAYLVTP